MVKPKSKKTCSKVPCGKCKKGCPPEYCYHSSNTRISSKNWCVPHSKKVRIDLHEKMPYIWRFLKPNTRKQMVRLAKRPIHELDIPFSLYGSGSLPVKYRKRARTLKKKYSTI